MSVDADNTIAGLRALKARLGVAGKTAVTKSALAVQHAGMSKTRVRSGTLRRSWRTEAVEAGEGVFGARVGPTVVYARRQELGFVGADSLGRVYDEPQHIGSPGAYGSKQRRNPYVKPALVETLPQIRMIVRRTYADAVRG